MNKRVYVLSMILLMSAKSLLAQVETASKEGEIVIEGELAGGFKPKIGEKRRVIFNISTFGSSITIAPCDIYTFNIYEKPFKITLPSATDFTYLNIEIHGVTLLRGVDNIYILEKGDSVKLSVSEKSYEFYGKGSDKLNCQKEIYDLQYRSTESELKLLNDEDYETYFNLTSKRRDSILERQVEILNKYAFRLGKEMTGILLANIYGHRYAPALNSYISNTRTGFPEVLPAFLKSEAYKTIDMSLNEKLDPAILTASPVYCNFLMEKIVADNAVEPNSNRVRSKPEMPGLVFNAIKTKYDGLLREKLLATFFLKYKQNSECYQYLDEAMHFVESNKIKIIMLDIQKTKAKGAAFFPFELEDSNGMTTRLSDLNGKVIILDFWYTGCENCIMLHQGMKPVVEKFKNNPKVEFVSVSIDKDKMSWLKSVASGKYTDPEGLNLYTNGLGYKHPLIEKYYIRGYPTVFLLKNGKVISAAPPRPGPSLTNLSHVAARAAFISLIEEALNDSSFFP